ncbi:MAG: DUF3592 domain-containing protein [Alphaproteobacteria bacterium]
MDFVFDAFLAWNQIGLIVMAVAFLAIGGGIMGYEIYWRTRATRVLGRISGIRMSNEVSAKERKRKRRERELAKEAKEPLDISEEFQKNPGSMLVAGIVVCLFIGLPLVFSGIGAYMGYKYINLTRTGEYAQAIVVDNERSYDSEGGTTYKAVLRFTDYQGQEHKVKDGISYGGSPSYKRGSQVGVYYDANDPTHFVTEDFWHNMGIALAFFCFGLVFILFLTSGLWIKKFKKKNLTSLKDSVDDAPTRGTYYAVFEYKTPDGVLREQASDMGSNWILNKMPGKAVCLMVFPNNPEKVRRPSHMLLIFGLLFFLPGVFIAYIAFSSFEANYASILMILGGFGFVGWKIWNVVRKIPMDELRDGWAHFQEEGVQVTSSSGGGSAKGRLLDASEIKVRARLHARHARIAAYIMFVVALGLSGGAYYAGVDMLSRVNDGVRTSGEVVDFVRRSSTSDSGTSYSYYSVVQFVDIEGRKVRFEDSVGSSSRMHTRGDQVNVLYMYEEPEDAMIDRGIFNWGLSGGLSLGGVLMFFFAFRNFTASRRYGAGRYRQRV